MDAIGGLVVFGLGCSLGGVSIWLLLRSRIRFAVEQARTTVQAETAALTERLSNREESLRKSGEETAHLIEELKSSQAALKASEIRIAELTTKLNEEQKATSDKLALLDQAR